MDGQCNLGKRSCTQADHAEIGGSKRRNSGEVREQYAPCADDTVYRLLCPRKRIGSIIGRGGEIVKQLRQESQSKIRIGESVPGRDERVITIFSSSLKTNYSEEFGSDICPAQDALFRIHERLVADETHGKEKDDASAHQVTFRLLIPNDQIGCVIGKAGKIIQFIRDDTFAQIRILENEHLPRRALGSDDLLQISGDPSCVRNALFQISSRLGENPSRSQHLLFSSMPNADDPDSQYMGPHSGGPIMGVTPLMGPYEGYKGDGGAEWSSHAYSDTSRDASEMKKFSLRIVCPADIGGVIGEGSGIMEQITQESRTVIKVDNSSAEGDECIISISAKEVFEEPISPSINVAVRLQPRCSEKTESESGEQLYTTRLLVPTSRIGCLIGKGGSIITEMRKLTRANIRILSNEDLPELASKDDRMVQISGDINVARNALVQVTTRLKANFFGKEGSLSAYPSVLPYLPASDVMDGSKYGDRDTKSHGRGYSTYFGGSNDVPSNNYGSFERESAPSALPFLPTSDIMDYSKYGGRDTKSHGRGYSSYFSGSNDVPSNNYGSFGREGAPSALPFLPTSDIMDDSKYGGRDTKSHGRGYSSYFGGSNDIPSNNYGSFGDFQTRASGYGAYSGYSDRTSNHGSSQNPVSHGKHHGH